MKKTIGISTALLAGVFLFGHAQENTESYLRHTVRKGESISLICIDYYGHYTSALGEAVKKVNPVITDINTIQVGDTLKFPKPVKAAAAKKTSEQRLFEKQVAVSQGVVTCVVGKATCVPNGATTGKPLLVNTQVSPGDVIMTGADGRVEIIINRESVVRMKENTRLTLEAYRNIKDNKGKTTVGMQKGTLWTKVKKFADKVGRFELGLPTAIAGVYGTVYQTSVSGDSTAEVKVFNGEVAVKNQPAAKHGTSEGLAEVSGPSEVGGPHEVSMEEWTRIVKAMQKITIGKDGTPSMVTAFKKQPADSWEQWNEERDTRIAEIFSEK